ncbi:MAG: leucine-rich repeat domain-containing protein [Alphaproteobacteria bacterium]|nr:leucine-rich repeat domain-containing protein [Alphaproteobacteria bacterium]
MKKYVLMLGLIASFNAMAEIVTGDKCGDDCSWTFDTDTGKLTISGTGDMYPSSDRPYDNSFYSRNGHWRTNAPWWPYSMQISDVDIQSGITSIGRWAFYGTTVKNVDIPDTITRIERESFQYSALENISIPDSVSSIEFATFMNTSLKDFVIPENIMSIEDHALEDITTLENFVVPDSVNNIGNFAFTNTTATIYCTSVSPCAGKGSENIIPYERKGGVYILDGKYYLSGADMAGGTNECKKELGECKRDVLESKGICQGSACDTFIQSDGKYMLKFGGKTYQDINALLKGNYDRRRIYTIEEANFVAGDKNRVSIRYR